MQNTSFVLFCHQRIVFWVQRAEKECFDSVLLNRLNSKYCIVPVGAWHNNWWYVACICKCYWVGRFQFFFQIFTVKKSNHVLVHNRHHVLLALCGADVAMTCESPVGVQKRSRWMCVSFWTQKLLQPQIRASLCSHRQQVQCANKIIKCPHNVGPLLGCRYLWSSWVW